MTRKQKVLIPNDYPTRIFWLRRRLRLTQAQFATYLGVSVNCVYGWENGQNRPRKTDWCQMTRLANGGLAHPNDEPLMKIIPDWQDKPVRVNIAQVASYRGIRNTDLNGRTPSYELHEYTMLQMSGGHSYIVHMCETEFDNIFAADPRYFV